MSNIDKRAYSVSQIIADLKLKHGSGDTYAPIMRWNELLALLEELEAKDKSISFLKDQLAQLANFNPDWDKLEAATYSLREHMAELTAARKRIAELEAREVLLPQRYSMLHRVDFDEPYHTEMVYKQHQVLEALHDAGVNVAAAAKGE
ncbi:hypothetical protein [Enterobacter hormaechei]|uniref:hypothetical protein n=1 Tax=Enterobacter hormaechei TaxID=158836 RepID=UPI003D6E4C8B